MSQARRSRMHFAALAALSSAIVMVFTPACGEAGPAAGDPCPEGDECGADLVCFDAGDDDPACREFPAECEGIEPCDCSAIWEEDCGLSYSCVEFGSITAVSCI